MNEKMSTLIGNTIGTVKDYNVRDDETAWEKALQVFIEMDLQKHISRSQTLNLQGNKVRIPLTYKDLPRLYFKCGKFTHGS